MGGMPESIGTTIETLSPEGWIRSNANLPNNLESSCTVSINDSTILIMGGHNSHKYTVYAYTAENFYFNVETNILTSGPPLNQKRYLAACSMMKDSITGAYNVVITGGALPPNALDSTEILGLNAGVWSIGPSIPCLELHCLSTLMVVQSLSVVSSMDGSNLNFFICHLGFYP